MEQQEGMRPSVPGGAGPHGLPDLSLVARLEPGALPIGATQCLLPPACHVSWQLGTWARLYLYAWAM